jgi:hypothetical protein
MILQTFNQLKWLKDSNLGAFAETLVI